MWALGVARRIPRVSAVATPAESSEPLNESGTRRMWSSGSSCCGAVGRFGGNPDVIPTPCLAVCTVCMHSIIRASYAESRKIPAAVWRSRRQAVPVWKTGPTGLLCEVEAGLIQRIPWCGVFERECHGLFDALPVKVLPTTFLAELGGGWI